MTFYSIAALGALDGLISIFLNKLITMPAQSDKVAK